MYGEFRAVATDSAVAAVYYAHVQAISSAARHEEATRAISRHTAGIVLRDGRGPGHQVQLPGWQPNAPPVRPGPGAGPPGPTPPGHQPHLRPCGLTVRAAATACVASAGQTWPEPVAGQAGVSNVSGNGATTTTTAAAAASVRRQTVLVGIRHSRVRPPRALSALA